MKNIILISIIIIFHLNIHAQLNTNDTVIQNILFIDAESNEPLSYTLILKKDKILGIANENGFFNVSLLNCEDNDVFMISNYGYQTKIINCNDLKQKSQIKLDKKSEYLKTVNVTYLDIEPLFKEIKKTKYPKYFAQYYFKTNYYNEKQELIFYADMIVNIYDTGKDNNFPYKLKFIAKRETKLDKKYSHLLDVEFNPKNEVRRLLWLNQNRNQRIYKENKLNIKTSKNNDTTYLFLHDKNDRYIVTDALVKIYNDTVYFFEYKMKTLEELIAIYKENYKKNKNMFSLAKYFINYYYFNIYYHQNKELKSIPKLYNYISKFEILKNTKHFYTLKYDSYYKQMTMRFIKKLDLNSIKNVEFDKHKQRMYELEDTLPLRHPYLDTIPFPSI
jgi:hypothetical protein